MTAEVVLAMMDVSDGDKRGEVKMGDLTMSWKWMTPTNPFSKAVTMTLATCHLCKLRKRDEGFPDRSRVCTQTSPTNNTTAANGPNSTIPPTIAANPSSPILIVVMIVPLNPLHGLLLCTLSILWSCCSNFGISAGSVHTLLLTIKIADC